MESNFKFGKKLVVGAGLLIVAGLLSLASARAVQPLTQDDVTLLLLGGSPASKIVQIVERRGVDFHMNPDLAKKFHDQGASDDVIEALQKAGSKAGDAKTGQPAPTAAAPAPAPPPAAAPAPSTGDNTNAPAPSRPSLSGKPNAVGAPEPRQEESSSEPVLHTRQSRDSASAPAAGAPASTPAPAPSPAPAPASSGGASSSEPVLHTAAKAEAAPETTAMTNAPGLKDPNPQETQHIIQEFAAKEKIFREARNNYTYHQINKVQEFGSNGSNEIVGTFEQEWDILYDDNGKREEKVTYAPVNTLKGLIVTKEDMEGFRNIQPFVLTTDELPEYDIKYLGHVKVDQITAYVFSIRPKEIEKNHQYFRASCGWTTATCRSSKAKANRCPRPKATAGRTSSPGSPPGANRWTASSGFPRSPWLTIPCTSPTPTPST